MTKRKSANKSLPQPVAEPDAPPVVDAASEAPKPAFRPGSKQALVYDLLTREEGASLDELVAATGWLSHTTRAALTGLRKRRYAIDKSKTDGVTRYRIAPAA